MVENEQPQGTPGGNVKIAAVTNEGTMIAGHFGMAEFYQVITLEAGKVISTELRSKPHHMLHPDTEQAQGHDHQDMLSPIRDCQILLCGGMRTRAYEHVQAAGIQVILAVGKIDEAIRQYVNGTLVSDMRRIRSM
jgi:predicted Fe-Mo cluster-binding NifX family protein